MTRQRKMLRGWGRYEAEVDFLSREEWRQQLTSSWHDLLDENGVPVPRYAMAVLQIAWLLPA